MASATRICCKACLGLRPGIPRPSVLSAAGRRALTSNNLASFLSRRQGPLSRNLSCSTQERTATPSHRAPAPSSDDGTRRSSSSSTSNRLPRSRRRGVIATALVIGATGWAWLFLDTGASKSEAYPTKFTSFTVTAREQLSPTAFILTVRIDSQPDGTSITPASIRAAWQHGLWSVEIKQPQLQIARHYTPLPPLTDSSLGAKGEQGEEEAEGNELRFLVRKMDTGEMSNYLSRRQVGDQIWLRGPHLGFDVTKRLGSAEKVAFLAGGTGVAPALQVAHKLLETRSDQGLAHVEQGFPVVSILWANRHAVDALGRQDSPTGGSSRSTSSWTSWLWGSSKPAATSTTANDTPSSTSSSSLTTQILAMKQKYGPRFQVEYFVDDEKSFITQETITRSLTNISSSMPPTNTTSSSRAAEDSSRCVWHSPSLLERLTGDNDVDRAKDPAISACACSSRPQQAGKNLVFVSGPDGFIRAYAGSKWWHGGLEMQGPVRGVLEGMMRSTSGGSNALKKDEWLVLKL